MAYPALQLLQQGQSLWLDYIDRGLLSDGTFARLVEMGVRGVTSNPTIFHKAITGGHDYDDAIRDLLQADPELGAQQLYHWLTIQDVQQAADILRPVHQSSDGEDGFVSLEVSPHLAYDAAGTIREARHLWREVDRPNLMIKVPATREGLDAIDALVAEGVNVNVTLLFSLERYREVIDAYLQGLARHAEPRQVVSVASFFVSRIDSKVDALLDGIGSDEARALRGRIAIASAKLAGRIFRERLESPDYHTQRDRGGRPQRLLWGSTSTKDPAYPELLYVESLIGPDTVNTVPMETLEAFLDHGTVRRTLAESVEEAERDLERLARLGIRLDDITAELEVEGVRKFADSYDALLDALERKRIDAMADFAG